MLERETGRRWHAVAQGVRADRFAPLPAGERGIAVSSYGRRLEAVHRSIDRFCEDEGLYYDATVAATLDPRVTAGQLYRQYAWHLRHSVYTVAWPVELTHPGRAGALSPMTCRWFEAGASATPMIGKPPGDPIFTELFGAGAVLPLDPAPRSPNETREAMAALWEGRAAHLERAAALRAERIPPLDVGGARARDPRAGRARRLHGAVGVGPSGVAEPTAYPNLPVT